MRAPAAHLRPLRKRESYLSRARPTTPPPGEADGPAGPGLSSAPMWLLILGCLVVAAATLVFPATPTYDPWAWILWGREIAHFDLVTEGGPSWKPLPILFTVPFSLLGDDLAPYLWLWIARAGGLLACVMAYRVARRLIGGGWYGALAGVFAALALFSSFKYVRDAALGNSEALLAALVLWAFERHLDGRRDHALYLAFGGALLRPEVWPFLGLYGLWLWVAEPWLRARLVVLGALVPALWFLPEWWGAGDPFRAGARANQPNQGSAAFADSPALELISRFRKVVIAPVKAGIIIGFLYAAVMWVRRRREGRTLAVAIGGFAWFALVAGMTEAGFAGNQRYLIVTTAAACVLGGLGAARVLQGVGWVGERTFGTSRAGAITAASALLLALAVFSPFIREKADNTGRVQGGLEHEAQLWHDLKGLVDEAGGRERLTACGGVFSGPFQIPMVAFELHVHGIEIGWRETSPPGVAFRTRTVPDGPLVVRPSDDRFRLVANHGKWRLLTVPPATGGEGCPSAGDDAPTAPA
nr:hypothetical protein [Thermoleophilaceae bacterium]